jgi:CBS domain-containing protein
MGDNVVFVRPVESVGTVVDILKSTTITNFPVVDTDDSNILVGTVGRNELCVLLKQRAFGHPKKTSNDFNPTVSNYLEYEGKRYLPLVDWRVLEESYPRYPSADDIRVSESDRACFLDLRPYMNTAPITVQEEASVGVSTPALTSLEWPCRKSGAHTFFVLRILLEDLRGIPDAWFEVPPSRQSTQPSGWHHYTDRSCAGCVGTHDAGSRRAEEDRLKRRRRVMVRKLLQYDSKRCRLLVIDVNSSCMKLLTL